MGFKRLVVELREEIHTELQDRLEAQKVSMSGWVKEKITEFLEEERESCDVS